jgi:hypothetical protein
MKVKYPLVSSVSFFYRPKDDEDAKIYVQKLLREEIDTSSPQLLHYLPIATPVEQRVQSVDDEYELINFRESIAPSGISSGLTLPTLLETFRTNGSVLCQTKLKILDLSRNDIDAPLLADIVRLSAIIRPSLIDLSFCGIATDPINNEHLTQLLEETSVKYLICIGDACATSDNLDWLRTPKTLEKLIWISDFWLEKQQYWASVVPQEKIHHPASHCWRDYPRFVAVESSMWWKMVGLHEPIVPCKPISNTFRILLIKSSGFYLLDDSSREMIFFSLNKTRNPKFQRPLFQIQFVQDT